MIYLTTILYNNRNIFRNLDNLNSTPLNSFPNVKTLFSHLVLKNKNKKQNICSIEHKSQILILTKFYKFAFSTTDLRALLYHCV